MRIKETVEDLVEISVGRRERAVMALVVHGTVRRALTGDNRDKLSARMDADLATLLFAKAHYGWLRTTMTIGQGTLSHLEEELAGFEDDGLQDELAVNPNADPVRLGKVAQRAGRMAVQIALFLQPEGHIDTPPEDLD